MPNAHRQNDQRDCGATTIVQGQSTVKVNDKLWAVDGDPNNHGNGKLINGLEPNTFIESKGVIVKGDNAHPDDQEHSNPKAATGSSDTFAGSG